MTQARPVGTERELLSRLGIARPSRGWAALLVIALTLTLVGVTGYIHELREGLISSGLRTMGRGGTTWGLYIIFAVHFIGLSFGGACTAATVRLFRLNDLYPLRRMAETMTLVCLPLGAFCILADLGRPLAGLTMLPQYAQPMSPFFGTFTMVVAVYLFANLVYVFLDGRGDAAACARSFPAVGFLYRIWSAGYGNTPNEKLRHERASWWLSAFLLPLEVVAMSTLGFVFGIQSGRPGWFSAVQAPSFLALGAASGVAMFSLIVVAARYTSAAREWISDKAVTTLGVILWLATLVYLYLVAVEVLTAMYAAREEDVRVIDAIVRGPYAGAFWASLACLVGSAAILLPVFLLRRPRSPILLVVAAIAVNLGAIGRRFLLVVPSQTHGLLLPYEPGHYLPSASELAVVVGLFGAGASLYLVAWKVFPLLPVVDMHLRPTDRIVQESLARRWFRIALTGAAVLGGATLASIGFAGSARVGTLPYLDPAIPLSPLLFIGGVMLLIYSVAAFETLPPPRRR